MIEEELACLVCPHIVQSVGNLGFVCHEPNGWSASCTRQCLEDASEDELSMIHLGHLRSANGLPDNYIAMPVCFAMSNISGTWETEYHHLPYTPSEGEIFAISQEQQPEKNDPAYLYENQDGSPVPVTLEEGTVGIPVWTTGEDAALFREYLDNGENLIETTFQEANKMAKNQHVEFLFFDFLVHDYDIAILVT
jgi:hypothetical protein